MLNFGPLLLAAAIATSTPAPIPRSDESQQTPPLKSQTIGTEKPQPYTNYPKDHSTQSPLVVEARVSGELKTTTDQIGQKGESEYDRWFDPISIFTGLLVLVGVGQVWFLRNTDIATTKAANAAKASADAVVSQLRAYVTIKSCDLDSIGIEGKGGITEATITLRNGGQTPATNFTQWAVMGIQDFPLKGGIPDFGEPETKPMQPLGIGAELLVKPTYAPLLTPHEIARLNDGTMALYVVGGATYTDAFKNDRKLTYCLFSNYKVGLATGHMAAYDEGNFAD